MTRTPPTTNWDTRSIPTTNWNSRTTKDYLLQESLGKLLLENGEGALLLERSINNLWDTRGAITTIWS